MLYVDSCVWPDYKTPGSNICFYNQVSCQAVTSRNVGGIVYSRLMECISTLKTESVECKWPVDEVNTIIDLRVLPDWVIVVEDQLSTDMIYFYCNAMHKHTACTILVVWRAGILKLGMVLSAIKDILIRNF